MMSLKHLADNGNSSICASCGGACCNNIPGGWAPFQLPPERLAELLRKKLVCIWNIYSFWEESIIIRPRNVMRHEYRLYTTGTYGPCVFLGKRGCKLPFEERPLECQGLIPNDDGSCHTIARTSVDTISRWWSQSLKRSTRFSDAIRMSGIKHIVPKNHVVPRIVLSHYERTGLYHDENRL